MAAGVAQHPDGSVQAGTGQQPGRPGDPEPRWEPAQITGGGDAGVQGQAYALGRPEGGNRGIVEEPREELAGGLDTEMDVAVDEAGQDRSSSAVHHLHRPPVGWGAVGWPGVHDPPRFDKDDRSMQRLSPCPVDERDVLDAERLFSGAAVHLLVPSRVRSWRCSQGDAQDGAKDPRIASELLMKSSIPGPIPSQGPPDLAASGRVADRYGLRMDRTSTGVPP